MTSVPQSLLPKQSTDVWDSRLTKANAYVLFNLNRQKVMAAVTSSIQRYTGGEGPELTSTATDTNEDFIGWLIGHRIFTSVSGKPEHYTYWISASPIPRLVAVMTKIVPKMGIVPRVAGDPVRADNVFEFLYKAHMQGLTAETFARTLQEVIDEMGKRSNPEAVKLMTSIDTTRALLHEQRRRIQKRSDALREEYERQMADLRATDQAILELGKPLEKVKDTLIGKLTQEERETAVAFWKKGFAAAEKKKVVIIPLAAYLANQSADKAAKARGSNLSNLKKSIDVKKIEKELESLIEKLEKRVDLSSDDDDSESSSSSDAGESSDGDDEVPTSLKAS